MDRTVDPKPVLTTSDLAAELQISLKAATELCKSGQIPAFLMGGAWRVRRPALEEALLAVERGERPSFKLTPTRHAEADAG